MAELADALDLGSSAREGVGVQVSPGARRISEMRTRFSDLVFPIGEIWRPLRQPVVLFTVGPPAHAGAALCPTHQSHQPCWFDRAPTCTAPRSAYPPCAGLASRPGAQRPSPYSTTPFLNAQITSCTRLCVPVFAMADDR